MEVFRGALAVLCWVGLLVVMEPSAAGLLPEDVGPGVHVGGRRAYVTQGFPVAVSLNSPGRGQWKSHKGNVLCSDKFGRRLGKES